VNYDSIGIEGNSTLKGYLNVCCMTCTRQVSSRLMAKAYGTPMQKPIVPDPYF